ncbi:MAG: hypothetical protein KDB52_08895 [Solirubrobacterales bacterium]|nr:hypothetical protein [Solirubrobacterales bacterium]
MSLQQAGEAKISRLTNGAVRRFDAVQKLEWFLMAAVTMILIIRTQLWLTNYPELGGGGLHIAHLLWGGLFMVISLWVGLIYLNRWSRHIVAILGGIGFGFFIDELGKFITQDNNYFFKPAAGIIYLIFVTMFLVIREISRRQSLDPQTALANALSLLPSIAVGEFRQLERDRAERLLEMSDQSDPAVASAREMFERATITPSRPPSRLTLFGNRLHRWIEMLTGRPRFPTVVNLVITIWAVSTLLSVLAIDLDLGGSRDNIGPQVETGVLGSLESLSALVSVALVAAGAWAMRKGRREDAYRFFIRALLVSILVTRVFIFIESQFAAVFGLALDLILFAAVSVLSSQEEDSQFRFGGLGESDLSELDSTPEKP